MIYYKVSITLTVIFIISCSGFNVEECDDDLIKVGFSDKFGYLNYCFANQFSSTKQFKKYLKEAYNTASPEIIGIIQAFFEHNKNYFCVDRVLYGPLKFCQKHLNLKFPTPFSKLDFIPAFKKASECAKKIMPLTDDEIVKIEANGNMIKDIKYGKNKFKNAIRSYNLSLEDNDVINNTKNSWHEFKIKYYEDQVETFNEKNKLSNFFLTTTKWCEEKRAEAKAAEEKMAADRAGSVSIVNLPDLPSDAMQ